MNAIRLLSAATALAMAATAAAAAPAAAPAPVPAAPAAPPPNPLATTPPPGPALPGVCVFSAEHAIAMSSVGKAYDARMRQLQAQAQAELNPERTAIETDARTLQGSQSTVAADVYQQRAQALNQRAQAYQVKAEQRSKELEATQQKNLGRITAELPPLVVAVYSAHKCSVVVAADALIAVNPGMDISEDVTKALNGKMTTISFDREHLDPQQVAPGR